MEPTSLKTVNIAKAGRFWAVRADGELLALVLYKKGALAVRDLLVRLAGIPANEPPKAGTTTGGRRSEPNRVHRRARRDRPNATSH